MTPPLHPSLREALESARRDIEPFRARDPEAALLLDAVVMLIARARNRFEEALQDLVQSAGAILDAGAARYSVPSLQVVQFEAAEGGAIPLCLPRHSRLRTQDVSTSDRGPLEFRTTRAVEVWPVRVSSPRWCGSDLSFRLTIQHPDPGVTFETLRPLDTLPLFVTGDPASSYPLHEALATATAAWAGPPGALTHPVHFHPGGFDSDDTLLPPQRLELPGDRCLREFLLYPEKFLFVNLAGLAKVAPHCQRVLEVRIALSGRWQERLRRNSAELLPNCVAAANWLETSFALDTPACRSEHPLIPDHRGGAGPEEIVQVLEVAAEHHRVAPLYGTPRGQERPPTAFWNAVTREGKEGGHRTFLRLSAASPRGEVPERVWVSAYGSQGGRPVREPLGRYQTLDGQARAGTIAAPTWPLYPPAGGGRRAGALGSPGPGLLCRLGSDGRDGADALRATLSQLGLVSWLSGEPDRGPFDLRRELTFSRIAGVEGVQARRGRAAHGLHLPGLLVTVDLGPAACVGGSGFLFGAVLSRFFGTRSSVASFTQLAVNTPSGSYAWPARSGEEVIE